MHEAGGAHRLPHNGMSKAMFGQRPITNPLETIQCLLIVGLLLFAPPAAFYLTGAASHSSGLLGASIVIIVILGLQSRNQIDLSPLVTILAFIIVHVAIAAILRPIDYQRTGLSIGLLSIVLLALILFSAWFLNQDDRNVDRALQILRWTMLLIAILSLTEVQPASTKIVGQPIFPFTEPSHFALIMSPLIGYACVSLKGLYRYSWLAISLLLALALQNLSMVAATIVIAVLCLPILQLLLGAATLTIVSGLLDTTYYMARLDFGANTTNQSALVYLQGWELIVDAFRRTIGWGVGFQNLGLGQFNSPSADTLLRIYGTESNLLDGGFVAAKLLSELGVFGLVLSALYIVIALRMILKLRKVASRKLQFSSINRFAHVVFVMYSIDLFVRGIGYFSASSALFFVSVLLLVRSPKFGGKKALAVEI